MRAPVVGCGSVEDKPMHDYDQPQSALPEVRRRAVTPEPGRVAADGTMGPTSIIGLQRAAGNAVVRDLLAEDPDPSPVKGFLARSRGEPLDAPVRSSMERALGADLADVRVHKGEDASASAASVQARAYTVGSDVVLGSGIEPSSEDARGTIAHELTHVVQQRSGPVDGTPAAGGIRLSDPRDPFEQAAEATAKSVVSGGEIAVSTRGGTPAATAQRAPAAPGSEDELKDDVDPATQRAPAAPGSEDELKDDVDPATQRAPAIPGSEDELKDDVDPATQRAVAPTSEEDEEPATPPA
jgi:hypothetical protein